MRGEEYSGNDFAFEAMPYVGQMVRFSGPEGGDKEIGQVGFIQEDDAFVAAFWTKRKPAYRLDVL